MLKKIVENFLNSNETYLAIRADDENNYQVGDICKDSFEWDYENDCPTEESIGGTCGTLVGDKWQDEEELIEKLEKIIQFNKRYGKQQYVIAGDKHDFGADEDEIIIECATVLYKL
ncbi:hypothetical protein QH639_19295 [Lysinibacillus sp. 1 U-2021]|uniref:hypothetical protein n=1 Tax=Lysinibacillus sp. 1 U-2021 TaxID=3039426 RepID=UPI002480344C|nr:hypothetical protein [Lysinibacillus sp. 1 U-2021]WGT37949.1 hypothetical protein QH639_19295 [Lysinibacillus sp. 1 U-2021]